VGSGHVNLTLEELHRQAAATGFHPETFEKAVRLLGLLEGLRSHPFLNTRIALKGGTALNLFVFNLPRLSVDIDLNYIGSTDRDAMLSDRPKIEQAVQAVCQREGLHVSRVPEEHAGGKWRLTYTAASGQPGNLELDVNFLLRTPCGPRKSWIRAWSVTTRLPTYRCLIFMNLPAGSSPRYCLGPRAVICLVLANCFAERTLTSPNCA
jgi:hypothetical protein